MNRGDTPYDTVCIGSSPLCLIEAICRRVHGQRVLVVERDNLLGGAWRQCSPLGIKRTEIGPHIITYNRAAYEYFRDELGLRMRPMRPRPCYLICTPLGNFKLPYQLEPLIACVKVPIHYLRHRRNGQTFEEVREEYFGRISNAFAQIGQWLFDRRKPDFFYPPGGTLELMDRLTERLEQHGVEVRLGTRLVGFERVEAERLALTLSKGRVTTGETLITPHQRIEWCDDGTGRKPLEYHERRYVMLHLLVKTGRKVPISFALSRGYENYSFIADLTPILPVGTLPPEQRLITTRMEVWDDYSEAGVHSFVQHLRETRVLPHDTELLSWERSEYDQGSLSHTTLDELRRRFSPALTVLRLHNLSSSIGYTVTRWKRAAKNT